jgi:hypothetical protein
MDPEVLCTGYQEWYAKQKETMKGKETMKVTIKYMPDDADYAVYIGKQFIAKCGTAPRAERLRSLLLGSGCCIRTSRSWDKG